MELYVDIRFLNNSGDGSKEKPFGTISEAAAIAQPGDTVHVAPGVYREYVSPANGGTEDARITYVSVKQILECRIQLHGRQLARRTGQLFAGLFEMV